jgi:single-stranded-DNA-specific exonuclease
MIVRPAALWELHRRHHPEAAAQLARELAAPLAFGQVLLNRGITDLEQARRFLEPRLDHLHDPLRMKGMDAAVARIREAIDRRQRILVHGDYDVDGVTATYLLVTVLRELGAEVGHHIPHRTKEGYGLSIGSVEAAVRAGVNLIVTVDCGISAIEATRRARQSGLDVVVTDHHEPGAQLPEATALINPHQPGCQYPFPLLSGVGVAFKLAQALTRDAGVRPGAERYLDVVALGTIADAVSLAGENRVLARLGLDRLSRTENVGLQALIEVAGLAGRSINAGQVAFQLAPRMNAAGRMGSANQALQLLMSRNLDEARAFAASLDEDNSRRRALDEAVEREATERVERDLGWPDCASIVLWSERWHPGVLGIVASRLVERFQRPTVLAAIDGEWARASGRSVAGLDLTRVLTQCDDLLQAYGGHAYAAGLTAAPARLPELKQRIETLVSASLDLDRCVPRVTIDADLTFASCDLELIGWLDRLPPHGLDNPEPVFRTEPARVEALTRVGDGSHLRLEIRDASGLARAIAFGGGERYEDFMGGKSCAVVYVPQRDEWNGESRVQIKVKGLRPS